MTNNTKNVVSNSLLRTPYCDNIHAQSFCVTLTKIMRGTVLGTGVLYTQNRSFFWYILDKLTDSAEGCTDKMCDTVASGFNQKTRYTTTSVHKKLGTQQHQYTTTSVHNNPVIIRIGLIDADSNN